MTPFTIPANLTRKFVDSNPSTMFLIGGPLSNIFSEGEPAPYVGCSNIFHVPIKIKCCMDSSAFFTDSFLDIFEWELEKAANGLLTHKFSHGLNQVVPDPRLARTNWAGPMHETAPKCRAALDKWLERYCSPYVVDYTFKL
jgi:hypothetical protein